MSYMTPAQLSKQYLQEARLMQLATVSAKGPWICTVYYVVDDQYNFYWLSKPSRRHSREVAEHAGVAVAVAVKPDKPVIGIQAEGRAAIVRDAAVVRSVMDRYIEKYADGRDFYDNFVAGTNQHELYTFSPERLVLFDEVNFPGGVGQELIPQPVEN